MQIYRKTIIIGFFFFFSYIMGEKVKNGMYTNTVHTLILVFHLMRGDDLPGYYRYIICNRNTARVKRN